MGTLAENIIAYLKTITNVTDLVGTGDEARIYDRVARPKAPLPYIVIETFEGTSEEHLGGISGLARQRAQIDCYDETTSEAHNVGEQIRYAPLQGHGDFMMGELNVREVTSPGGYSDGDDPPTDGSSQNRFWVSRDYFISYYEPTS